MSTLLDHSGRADAARVDLAGRVSCHPSPHVNLAVFASGRGSNLDVLAQRVADGRLPARISLVVSNNSVSGALAIASRHGIPTAHLSAATHPEADAYRDAMLALLDSHGVDLIVLAGFMKLVPAEVVACYPRRIVNVHPAPLPEFGGRGMYGLAPHRAVLAAGLRESAVCVHHVTAEYDQGPLIASRPVPIRPNDTPESLQRRAAAVEHDLYWRVIAALLACGGAA